METLNCRDCGDEFIYRPGKPGYKDSCPDCAVDIQKLVAEEGNSDDGSVEFMTNNPITIRYIRERLERDKQEDKTYER